MKEKVVLDFCFVKILTLVMRLYFDLKRVNRAYNDLVMRSFSSSILMRHFIQSSEVRRKLKIWIIDRLTECQTYCTAEFN